MFFDYKFWHYLTRPHELAGSLQTATMRKYRSRVFFVILAGLFIFACRNIWGMGTEALTPILATMSLEDYTLARISSLVGMLIWAILYMAFHYYGVAYILSLITSIPFRKLLPLQLLVTGLLLMEKALVFFVFAVKGASASVSFLSFGPLAATVLENWYLILFLNQLTITGALIIALQYRYIRSFEGMREQRHLLWTLFGIHLFMAFITAAVGFIPFETLYYKVVGGGS
ncbi:hypothetical protein NCCP2222_33700 [Sporosarcina sp. NCCP-2222]|uniref:hypothetical protein n=1 Tax=Sporosarcina sp. NCCP-2222 TaxID=2935073 RepID=UPI00208464CD|nr:hypothetical protein [Sporosarcina sp. NCCP-2222]GKV57423.1 hypothetical protein NCCP2222_33700 [Sporosarcina sp. NCCP-2222]